MLFHHAMIICCFEFIFDSVVLLLIFHNNYSVTPEKISEDNASQDVLSQREFTCSKLTIETLEGVKYVQS